MSTNGTKIPINVQSSLASIDIYIYTIKISILDILSIHHTILYT